MLLRELFIRSKIILSEGGNLSIGDAEKGEPVHYADKIDLLVHNRSYMVGLLDKLLQDINTAFRKQTKKNLWAPGLLQSREFLSGSSLHFFNTVGISDDEFLKHKPRVGDIDTQVDKELEHQVKEFLTSHSNKKIGDTTFLGFGSGNEQFNGLFQFSNPPIKVQIDFEFGQYQSGVPDEWFKFSHSSEWSDVTANVKGVFHKYLYRALGGAIKQHAHLKTTSGRGKAKVTNVQPEMVPKYSFSVSGKQGGGLSEPYGHVEDEKTKQPQTLPHPESPDKHLPVMQAVAPENRVYDQNLASQFTKLFGHQPTPEDLKLQWSFLGTVDLMKRYLTPQQQHETCIRFFEICFEVGSQMIERADPKGDADVKFAAIDQMLEKLDLTNLRKIAVDMAKEYEGDFLDLENFKRSYQPTKEHAGKKLQYGKLRKDAVASGAWPDWHQTQQLNEAEVKAQLRKGMPHLRDLRPNDLLDLIDELHDGNGSFKLENIPLNVKVDGFGGRFGKNADGKPFMGTSRTEPRYQAGFLDYHQKKGTQDPEVLSRAQMFDDLFYEMMNAVKLVDQELGPDFLVNKQVTCEVLYLPFATETPEGQLKFVGIAYDKLPEGVQLALVPFRVTDATTGEDIPESHSVVSKLTKLGQQESVMFINNSLTQHKSLDVTAIIPPLENLEKIKAMLASGKLAQKREAKEILAPVALSLENAIIADPNIVGKDLLGKNYEGIVINTRLGPVKVTSAEQKQVIADKNAARTAARTELPRDQETKTAVVAIGSFIGHKGHQDLFQYTINKAKELGGDPYLFIGNAEGKADPIPPSVKVQTWHKLYPQYAKNISTVIGGGSLIQKIKHELINPLPGKPPRYDNIVVMVGEDRAGLSMPAALMKAVNKFQGYEHVKVSLEVTPRESGFSGTMLRNSLKNDSPEQALATWSSAFDVNKLGVDWIKHLMDLTRKGMGIDTAKQAQLQDIKSVKYANKVIREMRAKEFLAELSDKPAGKRHPDAVAVGQGGHLMRDVGGYDRQYHLNRIMMAAAMADGKSKKPVDMDSSSFVQKYNVAFPYTDEEQMMMYQAMATIPTDGGELEKRAKSEEPKDTNKTSPIVVRKKNRYGV